MKDKLYIELALQVNEFLYEENKISYYLYTKTEEELLSLLK